jgi:hypothetical protein
LGTQGIIKINQSIKPFGSTGYYQNKQINQPFGNTQNQNKAINQTIWEHILSELTNQSNHLGTHIIKINQPSIKPFGNTYQN